MLILCDFVFSLKPAPNQLFRMVKYILYAAFIYIQIDNFCISNIIQFPTKSLCETQSIKLMTAPHWNCCLSFFSFSFFCAIWIIFVICVRFIDRTVLLHCSVFHRMNCLVGSVNLVNSGNDIFIRFSFGRWVCFCVVGRFYNIEHTARIMRKLYLHYTVQADNSI